MSIEVLRAYRYGCDVPQCPASAITDHNESPAGWTTLLSTQHQARAPLPSAKSGKARLRALDVVSMQTSGRFAVHLCPDHPNALSEHLPRTDGTRGERGCVWAWVSCSCGARLGLVLGDARAMWLHHLETL